MKRILFGLAIFLTAGCASAPVYNQIFNEDSTYNHKTFNVSHGELYRATVKTIYEKNFLLDKEDKGDGLIVAKRSFQKGKRTTILIVQAKLIESADSGSSELFLSALETTERTYINDKTRFFMFLVPLPGGGGKQASTVKEGETVIDDKGFYGSFFKEIEKNLDRGKEARNVE